MNGWLLEGAFTNSHEPAWSSNPSACRGFYISNRPLWFSIPMKNIVTYLMAPGRCPLEIDEVKSQGAPQRTTGALTECTHQSCRARLINKCIVQWRARACPVTRDALSMPGSGDCLVVVTVICLSGNWPNKSCGARRVAYLYSDRLLFTIPHCLRIYGLIVTPGELGASPLTHWWP